MRESIVIGWVFGGFIAFQALAQLGGNNFVPPIVALGGLVTGAVIVLAGYAVSVTFNAMAEGLQVVMDIEENTRVGLGVNLGKTRQQPGPGEDECGVDDEPPSESTNDVMRGVEALRRNAEQGDKDSQYALAIQLDQKADDQVGAFKWFKLAAEQGHAGAQYCLGDMYLEGDGTDQDPGEGKRWMTAAAAQGNPSAISRLKDL